jgi:hypothetical protein
MDAERVETAARMLPDATPLIPVEAQSPKDWQEHPQRSGQPELLPVNFGSPVATIAQSN